MGRVGLLEHHLQDLASAVISESKVHGEAQHEEVSDQCGEILNSKGDVSSEQTSQEISKFNSSLQGLQHDLVTECNFSGLRFWNCPID